LLRVTPRLQILRINSQDESEDENPINVTADEIIQVDLPFLRIFEAHFTDVRYLYALLHVIPLPQERISIHLLNRKAFPPEIPHAKMHLGVCSRLAQFWKRRSGDDDILPGGMVILRPYDMLGLIMISTKLSFASAVQGKNEEHPTLRFESEWPPRIPTAADAYGAHIQTIQVYANVMELCFSRHAIPWTENMLSLRNLVLINDNGELIGTKSQIGKLALLAWLGKRAEAGRTVDTIEFVHWGNRVKEALVPELVGRRVASQRVPVMKRILWKKWSAPKGKSSCSHTESHDYYCTMCLQTTYSWVVQAT
jgi:hypothetical protein